MAAASLFTKVTRRHYHALFLAIAALLWRCVWPRQELLSTATVVPESSKRSNSLLQSKAFTKFAASDSHHAVHKQIHAAVEQALQQDLVLIGMLFLTCIALFMMSSRLGMQQPTNAISEDVGNASVSGGYYRADIDGLRAVAICAVVIYHLEKSWIPGGFLGVDVFFVISGYVVTQSLQRDASGDTSTRACAFYGRRIKRLMPAMVVVTCAVGFLTAFLVPPWSEYLSRYFVSGMFALMGWSNNYFASLQRSYFDSGVGSLEHNPFTHTWSLGVEEQFYLVFPCLLFLGDGFRAESASSHSPKGYAKTLLAIALLSSFVISAVLVWHSPNLAFYLLPSRLWELSAGALLSFYTLEGDDGRHTRNILQILSVLLIFGACMLAPGELSTVLLPWILIAVTGACCFILAGTGGCSGHVNRVLSYSLPVYIGKLSYSIYLWHWPVFVLFKWTFGLDTLICRGMALKAVCTFAAATHHLVENPCRSWRPQSPWSIFAVAVSAVAMSQAWLYALRGPLYGKLYIGNLLSAPSLLMIGANATSRG